jgi:predicted solute-binding protein
VRYLNARPLIHCYDGPVACEHPSELARAIAAGGIDAGLVPIVELFGSRRYLVVDNVAIASHGAVFSVVLAHQTAIDKIAHIVVDPASRTSVNLLRVLLAELYGLAPPFVDHDPDPTAARLLIGNQALAFRSSTGGRFHFLDLGALWTNHTGLPFVYAAWLLRPEILEPGPVAREFRRLKECGLAALDEIIETESQFPRELSARYLREHIRFDLGSSEKEGIGTFGALLRKHGLVAPDAQTDFEYI